MENEIQNQVSLILGEYGWLFIVGVLTLLFRSTIEKFVAGLMIFMGNDYNEDDVVVYGIIVGGSKLVIQNDKLKDIKIEKPLPLLDLSKYKVDNSCVDLLTELTRVVKKHENNIQ